MIFSFFEFKFLVSLIDLVYYRLYCGTIYLDIFWYLLIAITLFNFFVFTEKGSMLAIVEEEPLIGGSKSKSRYFAIGITIFLFGFSMARIYLLDYLEQYC